ncbi:hypothetical protein GGR54DRAFT_644496 [Hypoxylon sp. NC1633]|nr:hypothetical protein GGR54DRAFT_644496 [Hypoxylon sp. NC1633]
MATVSQPEARASIALDIEKDVSFVPQATEVLGDSKPESDADSTHVKDGVKGVEAITTWYSSYNLLQSAVFSSRMAQLATMASVGHQDVAAALAIYSLFGSVGSSVGFTVAGGLWTNILPAKLYEYLPGDSKNMTAAIYRDTNEQMAEPIGTPIRDAVIAAYADVMRRMVIVGAALIPLTIICVASWKNINVKKLDAGEKRARGNVF